MKQLSFLLLTALSLWANNQPNFELTKLGDPKSGYTLMVFGGIHGNEPGGFFAPAVLAQYYTITKGALWVIPDINQKSITKFSRGVHGDMNRKFAKISKKDPDYQTVKALKKLIRHKDVDLILNLHDGHGYYRITYQDQQFNPMAWGQSCVIDQLCIDDANTTFGQLGDIAAKVSKKLNTGLLAKHHTFGVKNTKTQKQDKAMQLSLTYYAITHNKPAFAIETSKNMKKISDKVFYQLRAIEAFMSIMGIEFKRKFKFTKKEVQKIVKEYGTLQINDNIKFDISNLKPILRYVPMKEHNNTFKLSHPLADIVRRKTHYEVFVGHLRVVSLFEQTFQMDCTLQDINVTIDGKETKQKVASTLMVDHNFSISLPDEYRVNVIGYTNEQHKNEKGITIAYKDLVQRFAIDRKRRRFRIEIYRGEHFCGMLIVNFRS